MSKKKREKEVRNYVEKKKIEGTSYGLERELAF